MIISISGKIGSGKDTVGQIIQYLNLQKEYPDVWEQKSFEQFLNYAENEVQHTWKGDFQVKKFADKLKDIVCIIIGCTRKQLEDRDFKEKELDEEWVKYELLFKDKFKDGLQSKIFLSIKEVNIFLFNSKFIYEHDLVKSILTPRLLLQVLGTQGGRDLIHPNIWVNSLMSEYRDSKPKWVITDTRFPNELEAVKSRGGITIRVSTDRCGKVSSHESETALDDATFDYEIENNGTIEELIQQVNNLLWEKI
jgi:hypothetical protein